MPKVNSDILVWARDTASLTLDEAADKLHLRDAQGSIDRLIGLEAGAVEPTRPLLVKMAKLYRRPLLAFYMSAPPRKGDRGQDFRTLPKDFSTAENALLDVLIRDVIARQSMVRAVLEDEEEVEPLVFIGSATMSNGVPNVLASIRKTLQIDQKEFYDQPSPEEAFALLREAAEAARVFVLLIGDLGSHHTRIEPDIFRGFALADPVAPFVIINDQDSHSAWSFTLLHELTHLWLGQTGVSNALATKAVERFCNDVAGEFLLSEEQLTPLKVDDKTAFETALVRITQFARMRNLSSSMVAYKLFRVGALKQDTWERLSTAFRDRWRKNRVKHHDHAIHPEHGGPNYYIVRQHRVGKALIQLVDRMMVGGFLTTSKAGKVLGVKAKNVGNLIDLARLG